MLILFKTLTSDGLMSAKYYSDNFWNPFAYSAKLWEIKGWRKWKSKTYFKTLSNES